MLRQSPSPISLSPSQSRSALYRKLPSDRLCILRIKKLLNLFQDEFPITLSDWPVACSTLIVRSELFNYSQQVRAVIVCGNILVRGEPIRGRLKARPSGNFGPEIDLFPLRMPRAVIELVNFAKELVHKSRQFAIALGALRLIVDR